MMLPSWFTRLRDVKAESVYNEQAKLLLRTPSLAAKRRDEDPASFAKSWSLQRASSKAKGKRIAAVITSTFDDSYPSISDEVSPLGGVENVHNLQDSEPSKDDATTLLIHAHAKLDPWDCNFISVSSCKRASKSLSCKEIKALVQKGHGVSDNDTEDFALTSETRSSFCSETSSADSSISCKSGCEKKGNQDEQNWQEGGVCIKSSGGLVSKGWQINCAAKEQIVQMRRDTWRGRGSFLFSYLTVRRRKSVHSNAEATNMIDKKNAGRDSYKTGEAHRYVENEDKENLGKTSSASREREKENGSVLGVRHNRSIGDTVDKAPEKSSTAGEANLNFPFDHGDAYGCTSSTLDTSSVDPPAHNAWLGKRSQSISTSENWSTAALSTWHTPPEVAGEKKGKVFSMRRRRQRGASISAVLPPDLQGVVGDSLALVKMSDDPYEDFRQSILEMIMEKDLEGSMDVEELLYCYLSLNAPEHHGLIKEVFSDVWRSSLMTL